MGMYSDMNVFRSSQRKAPSGIENSRSTNQLQRYVGSIEPLSISVHLNNSYAKGSVPVKLQSEMPNHIYTIKQGCHSHTRHTSTMEPGYSQTDASTIGPSYSHTSSAGVMERGYSKTDGSTMKPVYSHTREAERVQVQPRSQLQRASCSPGYKPTDGNAGYASVAPQTYPKELKEMKAKGIIDTRTLRGSANDTASEPDCPRAREAERNPEPLNAGRSASCGPGYSPMHGGNAGYAPMASQPNRMESKKMKRVGIASFSHPRETKQIPGTQTQSQSQLGSIDDNHDVARRASCGPGYIIKSKEANPTAHTKDQRHKIKKIFAEGISKLSKPVKNWQKKSASLPYNISTHLTPGDLPAHLEPIVVKRLGEIGTARAKEGKWMETYKILSKVLEFQQIALGTEHYEIADTMHCIGVSLFQMGSDDAALTQLRKALDIRHKVLGDHLDTAATHHVIGSVYGKIGDFDSALNHLKCAQNIETKVVGHEVNKTTQLVVDYVQARSNLRRSGVR